MSFEYNVVDIDGLESVRLTGGEISPNACEMDGSTGNPTSEQKRKSQMVDFLKDDFDSFHSLLDELIAYYHSFSRRNEFLSETLGVPDYVKCRNCSNLGESVDGASICLGTADTTLEDSVYKNGEFLYKNEDGNFETIRNTGSVPSFCSPEIRRLDFPEDRLGEVNEKLISIAEAGYEQYANDQLERYEERREEALDDGRENSKYVTEDLSEFVTTREEYTARELRKLVGGLFNPRDSDDYRRSAIRVAWLLHLDDVLQEDYHPQRAEAYLRTMNSPHQSETLPGQGGDEFEQDVREYLKALDFPMFDRVFKLEGVSANRKEMDIHTELPWGDRAIFEVFSRGAHSEKHKQIRQYAELLKLAEDIDPVQILLSDGYLTNQTIERNLLFNLLKSDIQMTNNPELPRDPPEYAGRDNLEYLGDANSLSYSEFEPDFEPLESSQKVESQLVVKLREMGYDPSLPVYQYRSHYGFCGPTIELGDGSEKVSLTLFANRESAWKHDTEGAPRNERMFERKERRGGFKWVMDGPFNWSRNLAQMKEVPVGVVEVSNGDQSTITPTLFDKLLRERIK